MSSEIHLNSIEWVKSTIHSGNLPQTTILLILLRSLGGKASTSDLIRAGKATGVRLIDKWPIASILGRSKSNVIKIGQSWEISKVGLAYLTKFVPSDEGSVTTQTLDEARNYLQKIVEPKTKAFISEAIVAFESGCPRASAVLSWVGAIWLLQEHVLKFKLKEFNQCAKQKISDWKIAKSRSSK